MGHHRRPPHHPPLRVSWALSHPLCGQMAPPAGGPGHLCPRLCPSGTRCPLRGPPLWGQVSSVQSLSRVQPFATPWTAARQESLSITNPRSLPKLMSIESVRPLSHLILCRPLSSHLQSFPASGSFPICASNTGSLCLCPLSPLGHGQPLPLPAFSPGTPVPPPSLSAVTPRGQVPLGSQHSGPASQEVR